MRNSLSRDVEGPWDVRFRGAVRMLRLHREDRCALLTASPLHDSLVPRFGIMPMHHGPTLPVDRPSKTPWQQLISGYHAFCRVIDAFVDTPHPKVLRTKPAPLHSRVLDDARSTPCVRV